MGLSSTAVCQPIHSRTAGAAPLCACAPRGCATYELTNLATLRDWPVGLPLLGMAWGKFS
ncbi:DUF2177 family protein [Rhodoferax saidenbachensis]